MIRWLLVLSMICLFLAGCEGQQESIQTSIEIVPTNTTESEIEKENLEIEEQNLEIVFKYDCFNWDEIDLTYQPYKNQAEFESTVRDYIKGISEYTECEGWYLEYGNDINKCTITFRLLDSVSLGSLDNMGGMNFPPRKSSDNEIYTTIHINKAGFEAGNSCLAHELTHMICRSFNHPLTEGLAEYMERKIEGEKSEYYYLKFENVNDFLKGFYEPGTREYDGEEVFKEYENFKLDLMNSLPTLDSRFPYEAKGANAWYFFSESFVGYLIEEYGIEEFMYSIKMGKQKKTILCLTQKDTKKYRMTG